MLARPNRIVHADDYRAVVRSGRRSVSGQVMVYQRRAPGHGPVRFGFIVSKAVGNAVHRNLVRRRLKAIAAEHLATLKPGSDVVVRALPGSAQESWDSLRSQLTGLLTMGKARE